MPDAADRPGPPHDMWDRPWAYLVLGLWFGLLTGLTESLLRVVEHHWHLTNLKQFPAYYEWLPSVAYLGLFGAIGLLFGGLNWMRPVAWRKKLALGGALGFFTLLYFYAVIDQLDSSLRFGVNGLGQFMLALGLVAVLLPRLLRRPERLFKGLAYSLPVLGLTVALWSGWVYGGQAWQERRVAAELRPRLEASPNVLLIVLDTVRASNMSLYGHHRPTTPNLERLTASSVVFDNAIAGSSWTLPSHATMFTGLPLHDLPDLELGGLPDGAMTLAEVLHEQGYLTAGFVGNLLYCHRQTGLAQGFAHYNDHCLSFGTLLDYPRLGKGVRYVAHRLFGLSRNPPRKSAQRVNDEFLAWRDRCPNRPFFAFLNYFDAHDPYTPPPPFDATYGPSSPADRALLDRWFEEAVHKGNVTPQQIEMARKAYDGCIAYLDQQLGLLLGELEKRGDLENTLVIITSDHGEEFGEHQIFTHGNSLYQPQVHVPLLIRLPGRLPAGRRVHQPVSLTDLPATILDLLGMREAPLPGRILTSHLDSPQPAPASVPLPVLTELDHSPFHGLGKNIPNAHGSVRAVYSQAKKYIRKDVDGAEELYDLENDPGEERDLVKLDSHRPVLPKLRTQLVELVPQLAPNLTPLLGPPPKPEAVPAATSPLKRH